MNARIEALGTATFRRQRNSALVVGQTRRFLLRRRLWILDIGQRIRRAVDIIAALIGLAIALPLLVFAALAIKLTSKGPILFRQRRVGRHGRDFMILKLRTMYIDAEARRAALTANTDEIRFKMRKDPRITPIGRWLRRFSIDELPQLWNVFVGDMTLIGPRPALCAEVDRYDALALRRLEVQQGLTCLWQVNRRSELSFEEQVKLDIEYIDRTSAADDVRVLLKTIPAVVGGRGAY
jgi:lipopolysaccharide/colanic/teichoic acid biosynthesis glycosyltransferase